MNKKEFGELIRAQRQLSGLSIVELASALKIHKQDLYAIEYGVRNVANPKRERMLAFFGIEYKVVTTVSKKVEK